ncbi:pyridoxine kinase [Pilibacter termitis]|uniref:pyridoxal kinase n=1 Tax=Pilibacter termitis TaxID=263852 RepID=A0A1T4L1T2_9ENTE|nr:bifunctional hydroxymethylpyrimidine kinase/phosphomethylpyrimidine kinase [Pilibacter termitis]SJZ48541.1 pyridoxine kinase [Pilibacter termitis]
MPKKIITIAGSDSLSGGGVQADLATFSQYGLFAFSALTSIVTVVEDDFVIHEITSMLLTEQLETIFAFENISAIKIGLLPNVEIIRLVGEYLKNHANIPVILDTVMVFKETGTVTLSEIKEAMIEYLFPFAEIVTPNLEEAKVLSGMETINTIEEMEVAARRIHALGVKNVVIKGGERLAGVDACDVLFDGEVMREFHAKKLSGNRNNGAGCTFASAIAANIALSRSIYDAVSDAKEFVYEGIQNGVELTNEIGNVWQGARNHKNGGIT